MQPLDFLNDFPYPKTALILGGSGFLGSYLCEQLVDDGWHLTVPTRLYHRARHLLPLPTLHLLEANIHDPAVLASLAANHSAVINLVGTLHSDRRPPYGSAFEQIHVTLPRNLAHACRQAEVKRLIHVSALGASAQGASLYQRSKAAGEEALIQGLAGSSVNWTIFRPSLIFGPGDNFLSSLARMARYAPVLMLPSPQTLMQPIYVGDVAQTIVRALAHPSTYERIYELAGPHSYSLKELAELVSLWSGHPRKVLTMPGPVAQAMAGVAGIFSKRPVLTKDQLDMLQSPNVLTTAMAQELQLHPTPVEAILPSALDSHGNYLNYLRGRHAQRR